MWVARNCKTKQKSKFQIGIQFKDFGFSLGCSLSNKPNASTSRCFPNLMFTFVFISSNYIHRHITIWNISIFWKCSKTFRIWCSTLMLWVKSKNLKCPHFDIFISTFEINLYNLFYFSNLKDFQDFQINGVEF